MKRRESSSRLSALDGTGSVGVGEMALVPARLPDRLGLHVGLLGPAAAAGGDAPLEVTTPPPPPLDVATPPPEGRCRRRPAWAGAEPGDGMSLALAMAKAINAVCFYRPGLCGCVTVVS